MAGFLFRISMPQQFNQRFGRAFHSMKQACKQVVLDGEGLEKQQRREALCSDQVRDGRSILQATAKKAPLSGRGYGKQGGGGRGGRGGKETRHKRQATSDK